jgi:hypothetical protein
MGRAAKTVGRWLKIMSLLIALAVLVPTAAAAAYFYAQGWPRSWNSADWSSTGTAPDPRSETDAIIQVYAARAGRWKGVFSVHTWIALKPANAGAFTRYDVVGWGRPVRRDGWPVDGRWYSNSPRVILELRGSDAERLIPQVEAAVARYPHDQHGDYGVWPGPNSNSFIAWIGRQVPGLGLEMPATAVGKDFLGTGPTWAPTPSGTGWQISWGGYVGAAVALKEGFELHVLGTTVGIDPQDLGIKLPGFGLVTPHRLWAG